MKKKHIISAAIIGFTLVFSACTDMLELKPLDKTSAEQLLVSEDGLNTLLAALYNAIPMEDFNYRPTRGFNDRGWQGVDHIIMTSMYTDEGMKSEGGQYSPSVGPGSYSYWQYDRIREVNLFFETIETANSNGVISDAQYLRLKSEAHFVRAYIYFGKVKRFGGVPILEKPLDEIYNSGDLDALLVERSTEKETWDFVLKECDLAIENLPAELDNTYRATKWAAYTLKSRAALYAASIAKYWNKAPLVGDAVDKKLVGGMTEADANVYYSQCISASEAIINNSGKSLHAPNPSNSEEAATNYQMMFLSPPKEEVIFSKAFLDGSQVSDQGHNYDIYYSPFQVNAGFHKSGRYSITLDLVDLYEDYSDDGTGKSAGIVTRTDGREDYYTANPNNLDVTIPFVKYDDLYEPFKNKDARLLGSVIVPGADFKGTKIIMQSGLITQSGVRGVYSEATAEGLDGATYYSYGAASPADYSGFAGMGDFDNCNFSSTGFSVRKFLAENKNVSSAERSSTTPWIDMRLAEVYLNYCEAVAESGSGNATLAGELMNALRKRAAHKDNIPFTLENVLKERRIELAFEGQRYWDMVRRRDYHTYFTAGRRKALVPMQDLREAEPKYVFVRVNWYFDEIVGGRTFQPYQYYFSIPGRDKNKLIQNPGH